MRDHRYDPNPNDSRPADELDLERRLAAAELQDISARMRRAAPRIVLSAEQQRRRARAKAAKAARRRNRGQ